MADEEDTSSSGSDFGLDEEEQEIDEPVPESWLGYSWYVVRKAGRKTHKGENFEEYWRSLLAPLFYRSHSLYRRKAGLVPWYH